MFGADLYIALIIGVVVSLIYTDKVGILPAGIIVPGYLALVFDQPVFIALVFAISIMTYLFVVHVVARFTILYGKRKFAAMIMVGLLMKMGLDYFYPFIPFEIAEFRGIGVIVPGLIANAIQRQGVVPTLSSTFLLSGVTFLIMLVYYAVQ